MDLFSGSMDFLFNHPVYPVLVLFLIAVALAVVLPWLQRQAEKTETKVDDHIINIIGMWLKASAGKFMRRGLIVIILAGVPLIMAGCIFSGF